MFYNAVYWKADSRRCLLRRSEGVLAVVAGFLLCFFVVCLASAQAAQGAVVALCADAWCPYNCAPGSSRPGYVVEIAQEVFVPAGYRVTYEEVNWARCVDDAGAGRFSGIIGAIPSDAPGFTFPASPVGMSGDAYGVRKGDPFVFTGEKSLSGRVLGVIRSYSFSGPIGDYIAAHGNDGSRVEWVAGDGALTKNLEKLVAGRVDVVLDDRNVMLDAIDQLGLKDRVTVTAGMNVSPIYIAFSPHAEDPAKLARILDAGMARLRASGRLAAILARYHITDFH